MQWIGHPTANNTGPMHCWQHMSQLSLPACPLRNFLDGGGYVYKFFNCLHYLRCSLSLWKDVPLLESSMSNQREKKCWSHIHKHSRGQSVTSFPWNWRWANMRAALHKILIAGTKWVLCSWPYSIYHPRAMWISFKIEFTNIKYGEALPVIWILPVISQAIAMGILAYLESYSN